ncbi:MAG TPA: penicillin-binding protein 2, partial [Anaeromyxobacteraceae bacterium]|nr:penicillin-binding protein 2 [Anaeromyxobacteraceae bacterium]
MVGVPPPTAPGAAQKELRPRTYWMAGVATLAFLVLAVRLYQLQILRGDEYKGRADENFVKELRVPADRGFLLDRNRQILVDSRPSYDVTLTPYFCGKGCGEVLDQLSGLLQLTPEEGDRARSRLASARGLERFRPFTVKVDIAREELDVVEANRVPGQLSGVDVIPAPHRYYRYGSWAAHLFGYMNEIGADEMRRANDEIEERGQGELPYQLGDYIGRRGLERRWEASLRGVDGRRRVVVDAKGNAKGGELEDLIPEDQRYEPSRPGKNLVLSLDWRLQEFAEKFFPATAGVVLAMEAKTGFLLALVDRPAPDPNKLSGRITRAELKTIHDDPLRPELFRAIQEQYHPGSTFKAVTTIAALEEGALKPGGTVYCPGHYSVGRHRWRCDKESGHGTVDLEHALGASCNVFYYAMGDRLGTDAIARWASLLGLGKPTGFDVGGEIGGVMPDEAWHDRKIPGGYQHGMSLNIAIGQGDVNVTPMQQLVLYGAIGSGIVWKPQVVRKIEDPNGDTVQEFAPAERGRIPIKKETREAVLTGLMAAVNQPFGTGWWSRLKDVELDGKPVKMAGKTGTAQVVKLGAKRLKASQVEYFERDHAWFASFAPAEDPEIVVVVLNEHSGFGASNAAPTAAAVIKRYFELKRQDTAPAYGPAASPAPEMGPPAPPAAAPPRPSPA